MTTFVEELISRLSLDVDEQSYKRGQDANKQTELSFTRMAAAAGAAIAAAQGAIFALVADTARASAEIARFAELSGAPTGEFQRMAAAAKTLGIEVDKLSDIYKDVNDKVGDFLVTGAGPMADFFESIGPRVGVTAADFRKLSGPQALQLYVDSLEKANLSQAEMTFFMEAIASDATLLLPLLRNGGAEMSRLGDEAEKLGAIFSDDAVNSGKEFTLEIGRLKAAFAGVRNEISSEIMPVMTELIGATVDFVRENRSLISSGIVGFFKAFAIAAKALALALGLVALNQIGVMALAAPRFIAGIVSGAAALLSMVRGINFLNAALVAARISAIAMNAAMLLIPILIGAAFAGLFLLFEDLYTFLQGGESVIGAFVERFPLLGQAIDLVKANVYLLVGAGVELWEVLKAIATLDLDALMGAFSRLADHVIDAFRSIGQAAFDLLPDWLQNGLSSFVGGAVEMFSGAPSAGGVLAAPVTPVIQAAQAGGTTMQDNRQYNISGADIGEVKRVINERNAYSAKTIDTGIEY